MIVVLKSLIWTINVSEIQTVLANFFEVNLAIVWAFMVAMVTNKVISTRYGPLKRIAREGLIVMIANTLLMATYSLSDEWGIVITIATLSGNLRQIWIILRDVLKVI